MPKLFTIFIVVAAILASPKHKAFTWSYRSSIYRVHWEIFLKLRALTVSFLSSSLTIHASTLLPMGEEPRTVQKVKFLANIDKILMEAQRTKSKLRHRRNYANI